jgi:hypothetical protein
MEGQNSTSTMSQIDQVANILLEEAPQALHTREELESGVGKTDNTPPQKPKKPVAQEEEQQDEQEDEQQEEQQDEQQEKQEEQEEQEEDDVTWAGVLGVDEKQLVLDEAGDFKSVRVNVDGQVSEVTVKDLIAGYQTAQYNSQKGSALANEMRNFQATRDATVQEYTAKLEQLQELTGFLGQQLLAEYQDIDWNRLRAEQPGEYAAAIQDYQLKQQQLQGIFSKLESEKSGQTEAQMKVMQEQQRIHLETQVDKVLEKRPEWREPEKFKKALSEMVDFVGTSYSFTPEEFYSVQDARIIELVQDAMAYRRGKSVVEQKFKAKDLPKFSKPGNVKPKQVSKLDKLTKAAAKATGYKKHALQTEAVAALLLGED